MINEDDRPNPEKLLESIKREESTRTKGRLKIFLGMAAGVGKTYAMLEAAQKLQKRGGYVVIGAIETHGREDTAKLLEGLQIIPKKQIKYKDVFFEELDLDGILKCKPELVLVDELAHSNVPGSRHPKRWQDIIELLDHGIDVYTTLNVQHIESLKDLTEKITGITIRETVPDVVIDGAASIELLDLSPDELLSRLKEGKVYLGDQSVIAARNFFQEDKLTALRELILRYTAEKVEHDLQGMVSSIERSDGWKLRERLLVAVSHSPHSQKLIRITRRLAFNLDAPWIALHVDTGKVIDKEDQEMLAKNLALARDLGAEVITTSGPDIAQVIRRISRQKSVTQIIIGRTPHRWFLDFFQVNTLMDHLARECSDIDLHVIRQTLFSKSYGKKWRWPRLSDPISVYFSVTCFVALLSLFSWFFASFLTYKIVGFVFLLGILFLSLFFKKGPIFFASILCAAIWGFFFIPSDAQSHLSHEDLILLILYLLTALITGVLIDRERKHKGMLAKREKSIEILYDIVRDIAGASSLKEVQNSVKEGLDLALEGNVEIILKEIDKGLIFDERNLILKNEKERAAANWVFQNGKEAGWSTSTLPFTKSLYIPLKGLKESVGVLAYTPKTDKELTVEESNFIYTVSHQLANYVEKTFSDEKSRQLEWHKQIEKTYESILGLISNLFEGPLTTIQQEVRDLKKFDSDDRLQQISVSWERIDHATQDLMRIIENISAMVNLNAGLTPVNRTIQDLKELVERCSEKLKKILKNYKWKIVLEEKIQYIYFDYDLIELLFYNLAFHAAEFCPPDSQIEVSLRQSNHHVVMSISGEGQTIPPDMIDVAFERFYRIPGLNSSLGFGLAIAKTIAGIHGGNLQIRSRKGGGMVFSLLLPVDFMGI